MAKIIDVQVAVLERLQKLYPDEQQELLNFAEFLVQKSSAKRLRRSIKGLCADLGVKISEADSAEARHKMWTQKIDI